MSNKTGNSVVDLVTAHHLKYRRIIELRRIGNKTDKNGEEVLELKTFNTANKPILQAMDVTQ